MVHGKSRRKLFVYCVKICMSSVCVCFLSLELDICENSTIVKLSHSLHLALFLSQKSSDAHTFNYVNAIKYTLKIVAHSLFSSARMTNIEQVLSMNEPFGA